MLPTLRTERLRLDAATDSDIDALWAIWREPDVRRYPWDDAAIERPVFVDAIGRSESLASGGIGMWTIRVATAPDPVGAVALVPVGHAPPRDLGPGPHVELIYSLSRRFWGRGLAREAIAAVVGYAFDTLALRRLVAVVDVPNAASHRSLLRTGFRRTGDSDGPKHRLAWYALAAPEASPDRTWPEEARE